MLRGGRWLTVSQVMNQSIRIVVSIILTRILNPDDFGVIAKVFAVTGIIELVLVQGLMGGIIQDTKINNQQISSLFWIILLWVILLAGGIFFCSPLLGFFYADNRVVEITQWISIAILFSGFRLVPISLLNKELEFRTLFIANLISIVSGAAVALYLAWRGYGYFALVFQVVITEVMHTLAVFLMVKWRPSMDLNLHSVSYHLSFGLNIMGSNLITYLVRNADDIALGKFQGDAALGLYSRAYYLMLFPLNIVTKIINSLMFPVFSRIQNQPEIIDKLVRQTQRMIVILIFPGLIFLFFNAESVITIVLGSKWLGTSFLIRIFTGLLAIQLITVPVSSIYKAFNRVNFLFRLHLVMNTVTIVAIIYFATKGIGPVAYAVAVFGSLASIITYLIGYGLLRKSIISWLLSLSDLFLIIILLIVFQVVVTLYMGKVFMISLGLTFGFYAILILLNRKLFAQFANLN